MNKIKYFPWKIYDDSEWKDHKWNSPNKQRIEKICVQVTSMVPDILYYPIDSKFPAVEFALVKNEAGVGTNQVFGIQVNYLSTYRKEKQVYTKLL